MYLNILKKDLKRKKVMNIIIFIFIILSSMFVASSVNNIITITTSLDKYFEIAEVPDYFAVTRDNSLEVPITNFLDDIEAIDDYGIETVLYTSNENIIYNNKELVMDNTGVVMAYEDREINYFSKNNKKITGVSEGTVLISDKLIKSKDLKIGENITIKFDDTYIDLKIAGSFKDAMLGSSLMGMNRFMLNQNDFDKLVKINDLKDYIGSLIYVNTDNVYKVEKAFSESNISIIFNGDKNLIKTSYVLNMVIAGIILVVSISLILIAFVVLNFTISFTLKEEYKEIGVMKAIGISNSRIRGLYLIKYLALSIIGSLIGFIFSIPFGDMLISIVSDTIVMQNDNYVFVNFLCSLLVVIIILMFSYWSSRKVKKYSAVEAIHSGTTGERYKAKSILKLNKTKLNSSSYLACNDIISSPKRYIVISLIYSLCLLLVLILANTVNTLKSEKLISTFALTETDLYMANDSVQMNFLVENGKEIASKEVEKIKNSLTNNGMPCEIVYEALYKLSISYEDKSYKSMAFQGIGTDLSSYKYHKGSAPQNVNEIAITPLVSEKIGATIGDSVILHLPSGDEEFIITAIFHSMNNQGEGIRISQEVEISYKYLSVVSPFQIDFIDSPNSKVISKRINKIKELYPSSDIYTAGEYVEKLVGVAATLNSVKYLVVALVVVIVILVTVLMERSFITKEKSEIALLKSLGFKNKTIISWHTLRFFVVALVSVILALILSYPLTCITINPIFKMMGAYFGIEYKINYFEICLLYPIVIFVVSILSGTLTSLITKKIKASDASCIE